MKLLIITQKVNIDDPVLGFFHNWIIKFSENFSYSTVICLEKGNHNLPKNVKVLSLGKEDGASKIKYVINFLKYIFREAKNYDAVFVHMNQEYVLIGGFFWKILGKNIYMWRNHYAGNFLTDIASLFCKKIFCTSKFSFTAKYKKTKFMPVGVDTSFFSVDNNVSRVKNSVLSLGRIAPSKNIHILIEALNMLNKNKIDFVANIYGNCNKEDHAYLEMLKEKVNEYDIQDKIKFCGPIANYQTPNVYNSHELFVNLSPDGMYDKTIFEAMSCGCIVLSSNKNLLDKLVKEQIFNYNDIVDISNKISYFLVYNEKNNIKNILDMNRSFVDCHDINNLMRLILQEITEYN